MNWDDADKLEDMEYRKDVLLGFCEQLVFKYSIGETDIDEIMFQLGKAIEREHLTS